MKTLKKCDVDVAAILSDLRRLQPERVPVEAILTELRDEMLSHQKRGVTPEQMRTVLAARGIELGERQLLRFLKTGKLSREPAKKPEAPPSDAEDQPPAEGGAIAQADGPRPLQALPSATRVAGPFAANPSPRRP